MICWVMYDIKNDRNRTKIAKACERAGLYRVQYSVFLGTIETNEKDTLQVEIEDLMNVKGIGPKTLADLKDNIMVSMASD